MSAFTDFAPIAAAIAGALSVAVSAVLSLVARRIGRLKVAINEKEKERDFKSEIRLTQVQSILSQEIDRRGIFRVASASLVFSQFIVGGILASSFVSKTLGETLIGLLGLLVLAASLISQHFRPDLLHKVSSEKVRRLKALRRKLEDDLYVATRAEVSDDRLIEIRLFATKALEEIETAEFDALRNEKERA